MARIAGVDIPREKRLEIALTYIFGIGKPTAQKIWTRPASTRDTRVRDLTDDEVNTHPRLRRPAPAASRATCAATWPRTSSARSRSAATRASATARACPVRGQRTHTNARTRKGPRKTVANKKKAVRK